MNSTKQPQANAGDVASGSSSSGSTSLGNTLAKEINQTDLGHLLVEYKNVVIAGFVLIVLAVAGYAGWKSYQENKSLTIREKVYTFSKDKVIALQEKKITLDAYAPEMMKLVEELNAPSAFMFLTRTLYSLLQDQKAYSTMEPIFLKLYNQSGKNEYSFNHYGITLAAIYENQNNYNGAITILNSLMDSTFKKEEKILYDLSRLAKIKKDESLFKTSSEKLLSKFPNSPYAKLVKIL